MTDYVPSYGLPEPDWELMDPVTGDDIAAFHQLSERAAVEQRAREWEGFGGPPPWPAPERQRDSDLGQERGR